ncbi:uncharacterized protein E0L32_004528 [Thyridium curvatum]|uniref:Heterokaryon incompatibility domain-containing protein n=1 Tax=Thyridium curvatum TaxID=1093900 RepID=A0A507BE74_9PEZI|nr:uncharacterized protein E0L32_004528 [Thyridium curvatum]TPX15251.1 hypothetical protein E0L32_004528 [Thyridium curvatum]
MDHLPSPQNPYNPLGPIPCLVPVRGGHPLRPSFDPFAVFYQHFSDHLALSLLVARNKDVFEMVLSSWQHHLFFETYSTFFNGLGVAVSKEELVRQEEINGLTQSFITTRMLQFRIAQLRGKYYKAEGGITSEAAALVSSASSQMSRLQTSLARLGQKVKRVRQHERSLFVGPPPPQSLFEQIYVSITFLSTELSRTLALVTYSASSELREHHIVGGDTQWVIGRLLKAGWCPSEVCALISNSSITEEELYYWSLRDRRASKYGLEHRQCKYGERCRKETIDEANYTTRHCGDCNGQNCDMAFSESTMDSTVSDIVDQGRIPLIISDRSGIKVVGTKKASSIKRGEKNADLDYVAISHVWSDGLGNPNQNAIPQCQLQRLQGLVNGLFPDSTGPVPFWLDTLCVPLARETREAAIRAMGSVYSCAVTVLVLDDTLAEVTCRGADAVELIMAIRASTWAKRLWTFSESRLAQELTFQFGDMVANLTTIAKLVVLEDGLRKSEYLMRHNDLPRAHYVENSMAGWLTTRALGAIYALVPRDLAEEDKTPLHFLMLLDELGYRWTSKLKDETICLAGVLGIDPGPILEHDSAEERMHAFLKMLPSVPAAIAFTSRKKSQQPGRRWMPLTFLGGSQEDWLLTLVRSPATVSDDGLIVTSEGMVLQGKPGKDFDLQPRSRTRIECHGNTYVLRTSRGLVHNFSGLLCKSLAIILQTSLGNEGALYSGLLVTILESADARLIVKLEMKVQLLEDEMVRERVGRDVFREVEDVPPAIKTTPLPPGQEWLVQ